MLLFPVLHEKDGKEYSFHIRQVPPKAKSVELTHYQVPIKCGQAAFVYNAYIKSVDILKFQVTRDVVEEIIASKVVEVLDKVGEKDQAFMISSQDLESHMRS